MERYFTFWRRLGAGFVDGFFIFLVSWIIMAVALKQGSGNLYGWTIGIICCGYVYSILMTGLLGQTLGKMAMGIIVLDQADEKSFIGIKRAFYRESVPLIIQGAGFIFGGLAAPMRPASYEPTTIDTIVSYAGWGWFIAELVTMLFNERRRAVHDLLASSVVIGLKGLKFDQHYEALELEKMEKAKEKDDYGERGAAVM